MEFIEYHLFSKSFPYIASDEELQILQKELRANPEKGDLIKGTGGARKIRMAIGSKGKSGGARVIYYFKVSVEIVVLIDIYGKGEKTDLTASERKFISDLILVLKEKKL